MPIAVTCNQCQHTVHVSDEHAGKRGRCPQCKTVVPIPALPAVEDDAEEELQLASLEPTLFSPTPQAAVATAVPQSPAVYPAGPRSPAATARAAAPSAPVRPPVRQAAAVAAPAKAKPRPPAAALTPEQLRAAIMAGFRGPIERVPTTSTYKLGILLTALFMVLLPLIYIAIILLACLAVYWHLTNNHFIVSEVRGRAALFAIVVYIAPLVVGGIMILFMIKPLFARPANEGRRRNVTPHSDPLLFEFVERICALVGAPKPRRIDIDCDINASAGFRNGWLSMLSGRDLVLRIGMPLVAGLSLQQFAGVLAHEFGHFSQGAGMRLTYIIRSINMWFVRVVYERDSWDAWLAETSESLDLRISWMLYLARGCVWLTRKILWGLMYAGHLVAGFMLRQMEFDADKYEARVGGSAAFEATSHQLRILGIAWHGAEMDLGQFYREGRLVDNLPRLMMSNLAQLPPEAAKAVAEMVAKTETGMFDTHPADKDRIASARAEKAAGVFHSDLPASALFADFDAAGKNVTWDHYCTLFGRTIDPKTLHPTEHLVARTELDQAAGKARDRFFAGGFSGLRPLRLPVMPSGGPTQSPAIWQDELATARRTMESLAGDYREAIKAFQTADGRFVQANQAKSVISTGVRLQSDKFDRTFHSWTDASREHDLSRGELGRLSGSMEAFEDAAGKRLRACLLLLFDPQIAARLPEAAAWQAESRRLMPVISLVATNHAGLIELRNRNATMIALLGHLNGNERSDGLIREVLEFSDRVRLQLHELKQHFDRVEYPFDHADGQISVGTYLLKMIPLREEVGNVYEAADHVLTALLEVYARALSRLCVMAEAVEADLGYEPLATEP